MSEEQQREAKRWWINRYIHHPFAVHFALRQHGLEPIPVQKEHNRAIKRWKYLNISFMDTEKGLVIKANSPESEWAEGLIFLDKNKNYQYISGKVITTVNAEIPDNPL